MMKNAVHRKSSRIEIVSGARYGGSKPDPLPVSRTELMHLEIAVLHESLALPNGDGLNDAEEALLGTDPDNPDTDGDSLTDGDEVNVHSTNPLLADTDGDGFDDDREIFIGTDPNVACDDDMGLPDWPPDFDDNKTIDIVDVLALKPVFGTPSARHDLDGSGGDIDIVDVLALKPVFGQDCTS